jgi:hypothetical protein
MNEMGDDWEILGHVRSTFPQKEKEKRVIFMAVYGILEL